jgi:glycosyltransferase involved in cell wall biosynthesis
VNRIAVSVIIPTYNGERFLRPAIEGIINQTFSNFELIVIDDGSTDATPKILAEFRDPRIAVITNERNLGIAAATNRGLAAARGELIALQDHDDISLPQRLQTQLDFLTTNPDIALVASAVTIIDEEGNLGKYVLAPSAPQTPAPPAVDDPEGDLEIKWGLLFGCRLNHTSVMVRRSVILDIGGYREDSEFPLARDYDLFSRIALQHQLSNLRQPLVLWRRHSGSACISNQGQQSRANQAISWQNMQTAVATLNPVVSDDNYAFLGSRAFMCTPAGQLPELPGEQVVAGLLFLINLWKRFCERHEHDLSAAAQLSQRLNRLWGRHAVTLAVRAPWKPTTRVRSLLLGARCLASADWPFSRRGHARKQA